MYKLDPPKLLFETGRPGRATAILPAPGADEEPLDALIPPEHLAPSPPPSPSSASSTWSATTRTCRRSTCRSTRTSTRSGRVR